MRYWDCCRKATTITAAPAVAAVADQQAAAAAAAAAAVTAPAVGEPLSVVTCEEGHLVALAYPEFQSTEGDGGWSRLRTGVSSLS